MMCSWSRGTGKLSSLGFSTCPLGEYRQLYPTEPRLPWTQKSKPWVINTLCLSPWASSRQNPVTNSLAWTLSHRFYSRSLTYAHGQSAKSSWQFSSYLLLPQRDQARLSARIATQTQRPEAEGPCQLPTPSGGTAGNTVCMCRHHRHTSAQQHQGVWHQQQRLD